jgi:multidrug resistance protein, MATE family
MLSLKAIVKRKDIREFSAEGWAVAWPMTLIMFFEFLIGLTDIYVAGRLGKEVQAAYGFVIQLYFVFIIVGNALSMGAVSVVSRIFTSNDSEGLTESVYSTIVTTIGVGMVLGAAGFVLTPSIIHLVNIPAPLKPLAVPLGKIYAAGVVFHYVLINTNGILRACKRIKASLKTMAVVCCCNILLNFYIVFETSIGFVGIALSTAISVCIGSILNIRQVAPLMTGIRKFSARTMRRIANIGWPMGLLQALWQLNSMAIFLILSTLPEHSVETLAALAAGLRIESAIFLPAMAFNMANAVIVGNLLGENRKEDAFRGGLITALMGVVVATFLTGFVLLNARWIAPFLSNNSVVIAESITYIYIVMMSEPFTALWMGLGGGLNGAGDTRGIMVIVGLVVWLVRVPLIYLFVVVLGFGAVSVWWSMNISQVLMALFVTRRYWQRKWLEQ